MLMSAAHCPPDRADFAYEVKWDGIRCIAFIDGDVRLQTRTLRPITGRFPEVAAGLSTLPAGTVLDGELVVFDKSGPDFERLRRRLIQSDPRKLARAVWTEPAVFMAFDLLYESGRPLLHVPFETRHRHLLDTVHEGDHLALSPLFEDGPSLFAAVCRQGLEGIVAKRRDSFYFPGKRACAWVKCKAPEAREAQRQRHRHHPRAG